MDIWLSWFAEQSVRNYKDFEARAGRGCPLDDNQVFRGLMAEGCRLWRNPAIQVETSERSARAWFADFVAPLVGQGDDDSNAPLAIRIDQAPVFDRPADYTDDEVVAEGRNILSRHSVVYLDLAERLFMMPGGVFQVRALFVRREESINRFCAVLTRPGTNKGWRMAWREGRHMRNPADRDFDDVWTAGSEDIHDPHRPINFQKIDYSRLVDVESMFWLALVCWQNVDDNGFPPMPAQPLPPYRAEVMPMDFLVDEAISGERISLFRTVRMPAIDECRVSEARRAFSRKSHRKCRHEVTGHHRWQACGKGRKERRRIWISGHQRGSGAPKTSLYVLPV
ncbi:hypothetical protein [Pseudaminobacter sp. NGMCC 1.201702]|uniref:hypothetical protein n=1 Tax=Pseudaminobacter sp. NGMCC 1.201702 TaxID=3391825 RepID=UPI0039F0B2FA